MPPGPDRGVASGDRTVDPSVLEEEREFFLRSLRDLEAERAAGDIDDLDYHSLRDDYTFRAAAVVRQLTALREAPAVPAVDPEAGGHGAADGVAVGGAAAAGDGAAGDPAAEGGPVPAVERGAGDPPTDADPGPSVGAARDAGSRRARRWLPSQHRRAFLVAAVLVVVAGIAVAVLGSSKPTQSDAVRVQNLDVVAEGAFVNGEYSTAVKDYEAALKLNPTDVFTLTGEGEVLVEVGAAGHASATLKLGLSRLESAEIANPGYGPAFGARGIGYYDEGDYAAAVPQFEAYLADTPKASWSPTIVTALATAKKKSASNGS